MLSIVVPTRNEPEIGPRTHAFSVAFPTAEIIVVDVSPAESRFLPTEQAPNLFYVHAPEIRARAEAMNLGARKATGDILWFLHLDCEPPNESPTLIIAAIQNGSPAGAFLKRYAPSSFLLGLQASILNWVSSRWHRLLVGTNSFFIRKELFFECGGFPNVPFLEDVMMFDRWRHVPGFAVVPARLFVSSRRYARACALSKMVRNAAIYTSFRLGFSPTLLARWYE
jgi:hypothetical protein